MAAVEREKNCYSPVPVFEVCANQRLCEYNKGGMKAQTCGPEPLWLPIDPNAISKAVVGDIEG